MKFPPEDFEQLRQLVIKIRQGEIALTIGKKTLSALEAMMLEPEMVAMVNIVELAQKLKLSPASLTRLSKLLGFHGFISFQRIFKQKSQSTGHFYSNKIKQLMANKEQPIKEQFSQQLHTVVDDMQLLLASIKSEDLARAKFLLANKNRVFIFGYRQSSAIASILRYGLALLRPNVQMLVQADHGAAVALGQLKKGDLLVVIGSSPYSNITVNVAAIAKKQHCQIIAITDSPLSPLNDFAEVAIHVPTSAAFYTNSLVASCFFVEGLLNLTAIELGQSALQNIQQHEKLLAQLGVGH